MGGTPTFQRTKILARLLVPVCPVTSLRTVRSTAILIGLGSHCIASAAAGEGTGGPLLLEEKERKKDDDDDDECKKSAVYLCPLFFRLCM